MTTKTKPKARKSAVRRTHAAASHRKPRQTALPGTERPSIKAIEAAAERYVEVRDERMKLTKTEVGRRAALVAAMQAHQLDVYRFEDGSGPVIVELVTGAAKVKVRREADGDGGGDREGSED